MNVASRSVSHRRPGFRVPASPAALRLALAATIATALVGFGMTSAPSLAGGGDDETRSREGNPSRADRVAEARRALRACDDRLIGLAKRVLDERDPRQAVMDQLVELRIDVGQAHADYLNAKFDREIAEIAVVEYKEGIFPQELSTVEGELSLAKSDMERGRDLVTIAKERQEKIKEVADENTAYGRAMGFQYSDLIVSAMLEQEKRKLALEQAESKKKVLVAYIQPKRIKELEAQVAATRSKESAKQAAWEALKEQLDGLEKTVKTPTAYSDVARRILGLIDRALPIEELAHARLDQLAAKADSGESLRKELRELTNQLGAIVEEAESAKAAADFARLKPRLQQAARRAGVAAAK
jgi:hypothetical protein